MSGLSITQSISWRGWNLCSSLLDCGIVTSARTGTKQDQDYNNSGGLSLGYLWTGGSSTFRLTAHLPEPRRCSPWTRVAPVRAAQSVWEGRHSASCRPETWWSTVPGANGPSWTGSSSTCWTEPGTPSASSAVTVTATSPRSASPGRESSIAKRTFSGNRESGVRVSHPTPKKFALIQIFTTIRAVIPQFKMRTIFFLGCCSDKKKKKK